MKIITYTLVSSFLLLFSFSLEAQSYKNIQRFKAGAFAGVNLSQIDGDGHNGYHKLNPTAGLRGVARIHRKMEFSMELMYSQRGSRPSRRFNNSPLNASVTRFPVTVDLAYADAGFFINFLSSQSYDEYYRFHLHGGLVYSRLIRSEVSEVLPSGGSEVFSVEGAQDLFRKNTVNLVGGFTFYFTEQFGIMFRHSFELLPLYQPAPNAIEPQKRLIQYWISVGGVYNFY